MEAYDYKNGLKRIKEILNDSNDIMEVDKIPTDNEFTYENGYYGWVDAIFVDIRDSTSLFAENKKTSTAKIIRCFTSEIIEILNDDNLREVGIRGDCVYAIYAAKKIKDSINTFEKGLYINTFLKMLNKILESKKMMTIKAGIGIATNQDLVIKAGKKGSGINNKVWIGKAVTFASKLSNMANKNNSPILISELFYNCFIEEYKKENSNYQNNWFFKYTDKKIGDYYGCNLVKSDFEKWINDGMDENE